jgi:steroid delta-isomerase-like uncharacterized protein
MQSTGTAMHPNDQPDAATLIRRWFAEVWNDGNEQTIDELFPDDAVMWGVGRPENSSKGSGEFKQFYHAMRNACSDIKIELDQVVQEGDIAFARWTFTMKHTGVGMGIEPTNKTIKICGMSAGRARDGKIVEGWNVWDQLGMARQLGLLQGQVTAIFP